MTSFVMDGIEYRFFDHLYAVSRCGKTLRKLLPYRPKRRKDGYESASRNRLVHRMVAICWIENPGNRKLVHHKDGCKTNNHADNLEWVSPQEHMGEKHHHSGKFVRTKKMREKMRNSRLGFKDAPETAAVKRAILDKYCPKRPCEIDGIYYRSIRQASIALNIHVCTVRQRCFSKYFPSYKLL